MSTEAEVLPIGKPILGPTAMGDDVPRLLHLTRTLAVTDFRLRFYGSAMGYLWQLMRPLALFGVLYVVFTQVINLGTDVPFYAVSLLMGIVMWGFVADSTGVAVRSLVERENLVRKIDFPRLAVPLSAVLTAVFNLALNMIPVFVFLLISGGEVRLSWLAFPFLALIMALWCTGLAMLLSIGFVRYRDVSPIWDVVMQAGFYISPIFYQLQSISGKNANLLQHLLLLNPFAVILQEARHVVIDPSYPTPADLVGYPYLLLPAAIVVLTIGIGFRYFSRQAPRIAELL